MTSKKEKKITHWMASHGIDFLRVSLGIIFIWFGFLKYFPGLSPIEDLAVRTTKVLTFGLFSDKITYIGLATLECLIGVGLLTWKYLKITLILLLFQMIGTIAPVFVFPGEVFNIIPIVPTLEGQYIIKNLIIISAAVVIGGTVRGGALVADPETAEKAKEIEEKKLQG